MAPMMSPTPQLKPWTPRSSIAIAVAIFLGGCAPAPEEVSVRLDQLVATTTLSSPIPSPSIRNGDPMPSKDSALPSQPSKNLIDGRAQILTEEALQEIQKNRQMAFDRVLESLRKEYLGIARLEQRTGTEELANLAEKEWNDLIVSLRAEFETHANLKGPLLMDLSGIVGFPDTGRPPRRALGTDLFGNRRTAKAESLREQIKELDEQFKSSVQQQVAEVARAVLRRSESFEASVEVRRRQLLVEATLEAERRVSTSLEQLPDETALLEEHVLALESIKVNRDATPPIRSYLPQTTISDAKKSPSLKELAQTFAASRGYKLVPPRANVRDVTDEMREWLITHQLGR